LDCFICEPEECSEECSCDDCKEELEEIMNIISREESLRERRRERE
jgi:hypothetical protein